MSSKATIHIGLPKTGTTSIQRFLSLNSETLSEAGFSYPHFLRRENHLQLAAYAVGREGVHMAAIAGIRDLDHWLEWRSGFRDDFLRETSRGRHWIFSSEHIASRLTTEQRVKDLRSLLAEAFESIHVIIYLRRQDDMAISSYSTWVRDGIDRPLDIDEHIKNVDRYDFRRIIRRWNAVFPDERVTIRLYPPPGSSVGLIQDFAETVGLVDDWDDWLHPPKLNTSLSAPELEFLVRLNRLIPRIDSQGRRISRYGNPAQFLPGSIPGPKPRLSRLDAEKIMLKFHDSNMWALDQTSSPFANKAYFEPGMDQDGQTQAETELSADQAIRASARLWKRLMDEYKEARP